MVDTGGTCVGGGCLCVGGDVWLGGTDCGGCQTKVGLSTQRKHACVFTGSDVREKCKRITVGLAY